VGVFSLELAHEKNCGNNVSFSDSVTLFLCAPNSFLDYVVNFFVAPRFFKYYLGYAMHI